MPNCGLILKWQIFIKKYSQLTTLREERTRILQIMGHNNNTFESILTESEVSRQKFENTRAFVISNRVQIFGTPNSDDWEEQIYAISATAGNSPETLNDFFEKLDFNLLISQQIVPVFYEEDDRCNLEYFMSFDESTINWEKMVSWQNGEFHMTFEEDNISRSSRLDNLKIRDVADQILNRLEYDAY